MWQIARRCKWAKHLVYCDMEGFAVEEDGTLILLDECGNVAYPPKGMFEIIWDAPVVHGHWESITDYYHMCSCCGKGISGYFGKPPEESVALYAKYCPNCGAKMDEVTE